jgi:hypothetical protein
MRIESKSGSKNLSALEIDLAGLDIEDIEVFTQDGSRAMPDFAASTGCNGWLCGFNICSCAVQ